MPYLCHCDICDARIENYDPHVWAFGYVEKEPGVSYPPVLLLCDACFPLFREEVLALKERVKKWQEEARKK